MAGEIRLPFSGYQLFVVKIITINKMTLQFRFLINYREGFVRLKFVLFLPALTVNQITN